MTGRRPNGPPPGHPGGGTVFSMTPLEIAAAIVAAHPDTPVGESCPACARVGLPENRVPCGVRLGAIRLLRRTALYRAHAAKVAV